MFIFLGGSLSRKSRGNNEVALLAGSSLVNVGLYHLMKDAGYSVFLMTLAELKWAFMHKKIPAFHIVTTSLPEQLRFLFLAANQHPDIKIGFFYPCNSHLFVTNVIDLRGQGGFALPLDSSLENMKSVLSNFIGGNEQGCFCEYVSCKYSKIIYDPLLMLLQRLTKSECQVLIFLLSGLSPSGISRVLQCHVKTISSHKLNAMRKLNVSRTVELHALSINLDFMKGLKEIADK